MISFVIHDTDKIETVKQYLRDYDISHSIIYSDDVNEVDEVLGEPITDHKYLMMLHCPKDFKYELFEELGDFKYDLFEKDMEDDE